MYETREEFLNHIDFMLTGHAPFALQSNFEEKLAIATYLQNEEIIAHSLNIETDLRNHID